MDNETLTIIDNRTNQSYTVPISRGTHPRDGSATDQDRA